MGVNLFNFKTTEYKPNIEPNKVNIPEGVSIIGAPDYWEKGNKGAGIKIAVIDTGCDVNHPNLKSNIIGCRNFTSDDNGRADIVTDYAWHGTHVAGTIAANGMVGGITGVAPEAKLLILKALTKTGGAYEWIRAAVNCAINNGVDIISMSLGGTAYDKSLHQLVKLAVSKGILVVCAAGNDGDGDFNTDEINYPAAFNESISVGSVDLNKKDSVFSASNKEIDLLAPGQGIDKVGLLSTVPGGYALMTGTSMAAPHVAGALALIKNWSTKAFGRVLTETELYAQLIKCTDSLGYDKRVEGNGILNLR